MKGATPSTMKTRVQGVIRRHMNQASGSAMATASAAESAAMPSDASSALRQPASVKSCR